MPPKRASMRVSNRQKATEELYKSPKKSAVRSSGGKQRNGTACSRESQENWQKQGEGEGSTAER